MVIDFFLQTDEHFLQTVITLIFKLCVESCHFILLY